MIYIRVNDDKFESWEHYVLNILLRPHRLMWKALDEKNHD